MLNLKKNNWIKLKSEDQIVLNYISSSKDIVKKLVFSYNPSHDKAINVFDLSDLISGPTSKGFEELVVEPVNGESVQSPSIFSLPDELGNVSYSQEVFGVPINLECLVVFEGVDYKIHAKLYSSDDVNSVSQTYIDVLGSTNPKLKFDVAIAKKDFAEHNYIMDLIVESDSKKILSPFDKATIDNAIYSAIKNLSDNFLTPEFNAVSEYKSFMAIGLDRIQD
jgi:hypothetical protein